MGRALHMHTCRDKGSPTFLLPLSFLPSGEEPLTSATRLLSYGPLAHLILTRWRASDGGGVESASEEEARKEGTSLGVSSVLIYLFWGGEKLCLRASAAG